MISEQSIRQNLFYSLNNIHSDSAREKCFEAGLYMKHSGRGVKLLFRHPLLNYSSIFCLHDKIIP